MLPNSIFSYWMTSNDTHQDQSTLYFLCVPCIRNKTDILKLETYHLTFLGFGVLTNGSTISKLISQTSFFFSESEKYLSVSLPLLSLMASSELELSLSLELDEQLLESDVYFIPLSSSDSITGFVSFSLSDSDCIAGLVSFSLSDSDSCMTGFLSSDSDSESLITGSSSESDH